jgi:hypothetical protein
MRKIVIFTLVLTAALILFSVVLAVSFSADTTKFQTIRILADGSVEPSSAPIQRDGNTYYFTGNVYASPHVQSAFVVEKDNIVINGAGYTLQGTFNGTKDVEWTVGQGPYNETEALPWTVGIDLTDRSQGNLTIRNLNVKNFSIGLFIWTSNNTITGNSVTDNVVGIMLSESSNSIIGNYIANNEEGVFLAVNSAGCYAENMTCYRNSLVNNVKQVSGCQCTDPVENCTTYSTNIWDNDKEGNYWSDYTGVDNDKNGKGDSPYIIDIKNQDRYPLMESAASLPTANPEFPTTLVLTAVASVAVVGAGLLFYFRKHNH